MQLVIILYILFYYQAVESFYHLITECSVNSSQWKQLDESLSQRFLRSHNMTTSPSLILMLLPPPPLPPLPHCQHTTSDVTLTVAIDPSISTSNSTTYDDDSDTCSSSSSRNSDSSSGNSGGCDIIVNRTDDISVKKALHLAQMIDFVTGPFLADIFILSFQTLHRWCHSHSVPSLILPDHDDITPVLLLFDDMENPTGYEILSNNFLENPLDIRIFLEDRYRLSVQFIVPSSSNQSYELAWAHFRGNTQIYKLDENSQERLILRPGERVYQQTMAGHLYVLKSLTPYDESNNNNNTFESHLELDHIVTLFLMPAIWSDKRPLIFYLSPALLRKGINLHLLQEETRRSEHGRNEINMVKAMLLHYWQMQRQVQILVNVWALPSLLSFGGVVKDHSDQLSNELWKTFDLQESLLARLITNYLTQRNDSNSLLRGRREHEEGFISMVFNQHETPTYYYPLSSVLLQELQEIVMEEVVKWTPISSNEWEVTGSYGVREYGHGSVLRWHVDPTHSQPITAIVHIADDTDGKWPLTFPRSLDATDQDSLLKNTSNLHSVLLKPGQVILLQTAILPHARLEGYQGEYYGNAYIHLAPRWWTSLHSVHALT